MKHHITRDHSSLNHILMPAMVLFLSLLCATSVEARKVAEFTMPAPENVSLRHEGGNVIIDMEMPLKMVKVTNNEAAIFTPVLKYGTHELKLKSVGVYGRTRYYQYIRSTGLITGDTEVSFIRGTQPAVYQYSEKISFRPWMENATLILEQKLYECCEEIKDQTIIAINARMVDPNQSSSNPSASYSNSYYGGNNAYANNSYSGSYNNSNSNSQDLDSPFFDINVTSDDAEANTTNGNTGYSSSSTSSNTYSQVTQVTTPGFQASTTTYGDTPSYSTVANNSAKSSSNSASSSSSSQNTQSQSGNWPAASSAGAAAAAAGSNASVQHVTTPGMAASVNVYGDTPSYSTNPMTGPSGKSSSSTSTSSSVNNHDMSPYESPQVGYVSNDKMIAAAEAAKAREKEREVASTNNQAASWPSASSTSSVSNSGNAEVTHVTTPGMSASVNVYGDTPSYSTNPMTSSTSAGSSSSSYSSSNSYSSNSYASSSQAQAQPTNNWPNTSTALADVNASNAEVQHVTTPGMSASVNVYGNTPSMSGSSSSTSYNSGSSYAYNYNSSSGSNTVLTQTAVNNAPGAIVPQYLYYKVLKSKKADVSKSDTLLIDFFQRSTELNPSYHDNLQILNSLTSYVDQLKNNPDITLKGITITNYSSPEGLVPDNKKMVSERVQSIKSYLMSKCNLSSSMIHTETVPENWSGLRDYVATHSMPHRESILRLIDGSREADNKEWYLKSTYTDVYPTLLNDVYPQLRYTIVDFDFDVKKFNDPSQELQFVDSNNRVIPLDDIFLMAQQYPEGSLKAQEIYLKGAFYYASSRKANYNAAVALLQGGKPDEAKKYIAAAGEAPDVYYTRGLIYMALGDYQTARDYMKLAYKEGVAQADVIFQYLANKLPKTTL